MTANHHNAYRVEMVLALCLVLRQVCHAASKPELTCQHTSYAVPDLRSLHDM